MTRAPKGLCYPLPSSGGGNWKARANAAEKEVERLDKAFKRSSMGWLQMVQGLQAKADVLVETLERIRDATPNNTNSSSAFSMASWTHAVAAAALSALPPPVPAEEGGELKPSPRQTRNAFAFLADLCERARKVEREGGEYAVFDLTADVAKWSAPRPTQAPQDVAGLVEGDLECWDCAGSGLDEDAAFGRCRRCNGSGRSSIADELQKVRKWLNETPEPGTPGTVVQMQRIDRILAALCASPISHETAPDRENERRVADLLRDAYMRVQADKKAKGAPVSFQPIWDVVNLVPQVLYCLDRMAEFERDCAAEEVEGLVQAAADNNRELVVALADAKTLLNKLALERRKLGPLATQAQQMAHRLAAFQSHWGAK